MKKLLLCLCLGIICCTLNAQIKFGIKAGAGSTSLNAEDFNVLSADGREQFNLALEDANLSLYGGFLVQLRFGNILIQPELVYNSNSADFRVDSIGFSSITNEKYQYLDIPLLVGIKLGPLRLMAGPEGHVFLNSTEGFLDFDGYKQDFQSLTVGWQGGIGLDIWKLALDLRFQGNLTNFGDHIRFNGRNYDFNDEPNRFLFSVAYIFGDPSY